ncbi:MAG: glycosyltransferase [Deltaproteobacteria bacterium]|nr:glycosyltransferase [Deltaproteobacteria bacterium]
MQPPHLYAILTYRRHRWDLQGDMEIYSDLFRNQTINELFHKVPWCLTGTLQQPAMLQRTLLGENARFSSMERSLTFSIVTPTWNTKVIFIRDLIDSCLLQSWPFWELVLIDNGSTETAHIEHIKQRACKDSRIRLVENKANLGIGGGRNAGIAHSRGDVVCFLDHDDVIHPQSLGIFARQFLTCEETNFIYTNEVKLTEDASAIADFFCKPDFSLAGLRRTNYLCHFVGIRRSFLDNVKTPDGMWFKPEFDGCEDHDLFLRLAVSQGFSPVHVPVFAYFWRICRGSTASAVSEKPYVYDRAFKMLKHHLEQLGLDATQIETKPTSAYPRQLYSLRFQPRKKEKVSVVIPFRDRSDLTERCLRGLAKQSYRAQCDIILINNRSEQAATASAMKRLMETYAPSFSTLRVESFDGPFNYGKIHNWAMANFVSNPYILLLNNDVELIDTDAVGAMLGELEAHSTIGFVGIRLMYPSPPKVQHGGIKIRLEHKNLGIFHPTHVKDDNDELPYDERTAPAVSFACVMTRRQVLSELGELDELSFPNGFGDVDMCLRAHQKGFECFYLGTVAGYHYESATRECCDESLEQVYLSDAYAASLSNLSVRTFSHDHNKTIDDALGDGRFYLPLRYRVADNVNSIAKKLLGPVHRFAKILLT